MLVPSYFRYVADSHDTTRPVDGFGAAITPAQNAKGAWTQVMAGASVTKDVWEIRIRINNADITAISRDLLVDIGIDTGAGFNVLIPNLLASYAPPYLSGGRIPIVFKFPLHIPQGATIGARASANNANLTAFNVSVQIAGDPLDATKHWKGSFVRDYGTNLAASNGTTIVPSVGAAKSTAFTQLGILADDIYYWQLGFGADDTTIGALDYHLDVSVGPTDPPDRVALLNVVNSGTTTEQYMRSEGWPSGCPGTVSAGDKVWGRAWCSGATADTNLSMIAYGVGGNGGNSDAPTYAQGYADGYAAGLTAGGGPIFPAMTGTTDAPTICAALREVIKVLVPDMLTDDKFIPHDEQAEFDDWLISGQCNENRHFCVEWNLGPMPEVSGYNYEVRRDPFKIRVAYLTNFRAGDTLFDLKKMMDHDRHSIEHVIGWRAGFATFTVVEDEYDTEFKKVGQTTVMELTFTYEYTRSTV